MKKIWINLFAVALIAGTTATFVSCEKKTDAEKIEAATESTEEEAAEVVEQAEEELEAAQQAELNAEASIEAAETAEGTAEAINSTTTDASAPVTEEAVVVEE